MLDPTHVENRRVLIYIKKKYTPNIDIYTLAP